MIGKIPQDFIDELLARVDIVEMIDRRVPLKKSGRDFTARCPFHDERTPSFTVSPTKQFYHCFGCGANGSAIGFLMNFAHLEFRDAVEELAMSVGLDVPTGEHLSPQNQDAPRLLQLVADANRWFKEQLRQHANATKAIAYLKSRGITGEMAARFDSKVASDALGLVTVSQASDTALSPSTRCGPPTGNRVCIIESEDTGAAISVEVTLARPLTESRW